MTENRIRIPQMTKVVLGDANVLYSRVFRDYLLYAAIEGLIGIVWSTAILDEMTEHLAANIPGFNSESAIALRKGMNGAFPDALNDPQEDDYLRLSGIVLPDEGDRHVIAAALAAEADVICTSNTKDFPSDVIAKLGLDTITPDDLLHHLITRFPLDMATVHKAVVAGLRGATDESTIQALIRVGAVKAAAAALSGILNI